MSGGLVTTEGKKIFLERTYLTSPTRAVVTFFKVGIGTTDPTLGDTDLENPVPINGTETVDDCEVADFTDNADYE